MRFTGTLQTERRERDGIHLSTTDNDNMERNQDWQLSVLMDTDHCQLYLWNPFVFFLSLYYVTSVSFFLSFFFFFFFFAAFCGVSCLLFLYVTSLLELVFLSKSVLLFEVRLL